MRDFLGMAFASALASFSAAGCGTAVTPEADGGVDASNASDGALDAATPDAPTIDAASPDGSEPVDAAVVDAALVDAATVDAAPPETCPTPGATETMPCGLCGTIDRFCTSAHEWAYGVCTGEHGVCTPGTTTSETCGRCGTRPSFCSSSCAWVPMGACGGETGACLPGTTTRVSTGCPSGQTRVQTCDATCTTTDGPCEAMECTPDSLGTVSCALCGIAQRHCDETGHWVNGPCRNQGECEPGAVTSNACGVCGMRPEQCDSTCHWIPSGACTGGAVCTPPPAPTCADPMHLRTFATMPMCVAGACVYAPTDTLCTGGCTAGACVGGTILLGGLGGPTGFGTLQLPQSDDGSSSAILLPAAWGTGLHYYDGTYGAFFVNNNGNISFNAPLMAYTPMFPGAAQPMIAAFWGDADTRMSAPMHGEVVSYVDDTRFVVTWHLIGYYNAHHDKENSFQLIVTNRADTGAGNFDVELRYAECHWTTGDGSGGSGGLGGNEANVGFDAGDGTRSLVVPGSGSAAVLDLCTTSNIGMAGVWRYQVRGGLPM